MEKGAGEFRALPGHPLPAPAIGIRVETGGSRQRDAPLNWLREMPQFGDQPHGVMEFQRLNQSQPGLLF